MQTYQLYLVIGIVLVGLEMVVPGFVLAPLGVAAIVTALVAYFTESMFVHVIVYSIAAVGLFIALSKWNKTRMAQPKDQATIGLVGQVGTLVRRCESASQPGKVQIFADVWDVYWDDENPQVNPVGLAEGARVRVTRVIGNRVAIEKL